MKSIFERGQLLPPGAARLPVLSASILASLCLCLATEKASACACGCGAFDIGANAAFPNSSDSGLSAWFRYNFMNQNKNWEGSSSAPAADNLDKDIKTSFFTFGGQYMINRDWGVMVELPVFKRSFTSTGDGTAYPAGSIFTSDLTDLGDVMVQGVYAGFSPDMSTGVTFGVKLPTGNYTGPALGPGQSANGQFDLIYDRDTLPGSGSTDLLFGAYHVGGLTQDNKLAYFTQARYQFAVMERAGATGTYRPGNELDLGAGLTYSLGAMGSFKNVAPVLQLIASDRSSDGGTGSSFNSGYRRLMIAPGIDLRIDKFKIYADVSLPLVQNVNTDIPSSGNVGQLTASTIWRLQIGYDF
ncbi:conserved exported hypothetical protein [Burkholderiales bacterium]|nr:conserved exported hypothetical protein [Burkholderiales bacterium]